jgi:hypothetical protein
MCAKLKPLGMQTNIDSRNSGAGSGDPHARSISIKI